MKDKIKISIPLLKMKKCFIIMPFKRIDYSLG
ncbi:MAG: hypothetical protein QG657_3257 [Acidobacteriota bacterium]|nr:hypothetical protein [Acidobacteriota bacterium]